MRRNYQQKLREEIIIRNYQLVYYVTQKFVNYRDTGVSKNIETHYFTLFCKRYFNANFYE